MPLCNQDSYLFDGSGLSPPTLIDNDSDVIATGDGNSFNSSDVNTFYFTGDGTTRDFCAPKILGSSDGVVTVELENSVNYSLTVINKYLTVTVTE